MRPHPHPPERGEEGVEPPHGEGREPGANKCGCRAPMLCKTPGAKEIGSSSSRRMPGSRKRVAIRKGVAFGTGQGVKSIALFHPPSGHTPHNVVRSIVRSLQTNHGVLSNLFWYLVPFPSSLFFLATAISHPLT